MGKVTELFEAACRAEPENGPTMERLDEAIGALSALDPTNDRELLRLLDRVAEFPRERLEALKRWLDGPPTPERTPAWTAGQWRMVADALGEAAERIGVSPEQDWRHALADEAWRMAKAQESAPHRWGGGAEGEQLCCDCGVDAQDGEAERACGQAAILRAGTNPPCLAAGMVVRKPGFHSQWTVAEKRVDGLARIESTYLGSMMSKWTDGNAGQDWLLAKDFDPKEGR